MCPYSGSPPRRAPQPQRCPTSTPHSDPSATPDPESPRPSRGSPHSRYPALTATPSTRSELAPLLPAPQNRPPRVLPPTLHRPAPRYRPPHPQAAPGDPGTAPSPVPDPRAPPPLRRCRPGSAARANYRTIGAPGGALPPSLHPRRRGWDLPGPRGPTAAAARGGRAPRQLG